VDRCLSEKKNQASPTTENLLYIWWAASSRPLRAEIKSEKERKKVHQQNLMSSDLYAGQPNNGQETTTNISSPKIQFWILLFISSTIYITLTCYTLRRSLLEARLLERRHHMAMHH